jgi:hypothetical protein
LTILEKDGVTYTPDLVNCDAQESAILSTLTCSVPVSVLIAEPYILTWADPVYAKLSASNVYGTSIYSLAGNGAILHTIPDAPTLVLENLVHRTASTIGLYWSTTFVGGTPIVDYTVQSDQGLDTFTTIASGITVKSHTATGLTFGVTYKFRVSARNAFGDSNWSTEFIILCATKPLKPLGPTTTAVNANVLVSWVAPDD